MNIDDYDESLARIKAAWDKLPDPGPELMRRFERNAQDWDLFRVSVAADDKEMFEAMDIAARIQVQVYVYKLLTRPSPNPIEPHDPHPQCG